MNDEKIPILVRSFQKTSGGILELFLVQSWHAVKTQQKNRTLFHTLICTIFWEGQFKIPINFGSVKILNGLNGWELKNCPRGVDG